MLNRVQFIMSACVLFNFFPVHQNNYSGKKYIPKRYFTNQHFAIFDAQKVEKKFENQRYFDIH